MTWAWRALKLGMAVAVLAVYGVWAALAVAFFAFCVVGALVSLMSEAAAVDDE